MEKKPKKNPKKFYCTKCDFLSRNKKDYNRHVLTRKHKMDNMDNNWITKKTHYCTLCDKTYKYASGLSKHKRKCVSVESKENVKIRKKHTTQVGKTSGMDQEKALLKEEISELRTMMTKLIVQKKKKTLI